LAFQGILQHAVANEQEPGLRLLGHYLAGCLDNVSMSLEMKQASDLGDDDVVALIPKIAPHALALASRCEKRLDLHAAIDGREFFSRSNAGLDQQIGHRVGHADHRVTAPGRPSLTAAKKLS